MLISPSTDAFVRQQEVAPIDLLARTRVVVIGIGAVGSFTALALAKMGVGEISLWDDDRVEEHNLPNQWYRPADVGRAKTEALAEILAAYGAFKVEIHATRYVAQVLRGIVVSAVDSMDTRMDIWRTIKRMKNVPYYIDARMSAEVGRLLVARPGVQDSMDVYAEELYPSAEAYRDTCTARATIYCASGLASYIAAKVVKLVTGRPYRSCVSIDFRQALIV